MGEIYAYQRKGKNSVNAAGIAARTTGVLSNCYNIGLIQAESEKSVRNVGIAAIVEGNNSSVVNCYWSTEKTSAGIAYANSTNTVEATGMAENNMKTSAFVNNLGSNNWKIISTLNSGFPILEWQE